MTEAQPDGTSPFRVYYSYATADERLLERLEKHLSGLERQGLMRGWHRGKIGPGEDAPQLIEHNFKKAKVILLLVSADSVAVEDFYKEILWAMERHEDGTAYVIPVLLRPVDITGYAFARLLCVPRNQIPVTQWSDHGRAFEDVTRSIRAIIEHLHSSSRDGKLTAPVRMRPKLFMAADIVSTQLVARPAFKAFFRRIANGEEPGYPRFQGRNRYNSFTYPQGGFSLTHDSRVCLSKIGSIKVKLHGPIEGTIKTCTIKYEAGSWYVVFSCEVKQPEPLPSVSSEVGIDLGVTHFAALSDGTFIESPRYYRKAAAKLRRNQHTLSKRKRGSHRRERARKAVAKAHRKIRNQRRDFHHKQAKKLVQEHQMIVFEQLEITNISKRAKPKQDEDGNYLPNGAAAKSGLNKSILDAGWGQFQQIVASKAVYAGRTVIKVNPRYTSQVCSQCGTVRKKSLEERWHSCECGAELDRDTNAAINILRLGRSQRIPPSRASVESCVEASCL